jgi:thiamine pyrophosphokinase
MHCTIFTGGRFPQKKYIKPFIHNTDMIIAADSGYDSAQKLGYQSDLLIGDMDSIVGNHANTETVVFPKDKDHTDTELALLKARDSGADQILLIGGGGGRLDHFLGIYHCFFRKLHPDHWLTHSAYIQRIDQPCELHGKKGGELSFIPISTEGLICKTWGLKWPLNALPWKLGDVGISNVAMEDSIRIEIQSGALLCVQQLSEGMFK